MGVDWFLVSLNVQKAVSPVTNFKYRGGLVFSVMNPQKAVSPVSILKDQE